MIELVDIMNEIEQKMRLNGKNEAKSQRDDKTKIYNSYICLIKLSIAAMSLVQSL